MFLLQSEKFISSTQKLASFSLISWETSIHWLNPKTRLNCVWFIKERKALEKFYIQADIVQLFNWIKSRYYLEHFQNQQSFCSISLSEVRTKLI